MPIDSVNDATSKHRFYLELRRLIYLVIIGALFVLIYGLGHGSSGAANVLGVISMGLMAGGASFVSGGLLGFLFGVPHSQGRETASASQGTGETSSETGKSTPSTTYRPNTSLEQISDWLTKMLVGVGLVEIKVIPGKLRGLAAYIAKGIGPETQAESFALAIVIYFSACGFLFGFLWARLNLVHLFREGDVQMLEAKVSLLEKRQLADAKAMAVVNHQLNRQADDPARTDNEVAAAIKAASPSVKALIFNQAQKASAYKTVEDYETKVEGAVSVFKGLIASDTKGQYHRNHSELSYALRRQNPPDLKTGEAELTKAIKIRDSLGKTGWKSYEFYRARCRIEQDRTFQKNDPTFVEQVLADLRIAYSEKEKWKSRLSDNKSVRDWLAHNRRMDDKGAVNLS